MPNIDRDDENATRYADECSNDPNAPHGFDRNASHSEGRYVCECEHYEANKMTAPDKPKIDEMIKRQRWVIGEYTGADIDIAILATLEAHKRIVEAAEVPEPVIHELHFRGIPRQVIYKDHYDNLLAAYHKALAERDEARNILKAAGIRPRGKSVMPHIVRAETAERQLAECQKECEEQARLNGMGSEREARLMAQLAELREKHERLVARLREPSEKMLEAMRRVIYHSKDTLTKAIKAVSTVALRDSEGGE